jgi:hypothetical protein
MTAAAITPVRYGTLTVEQLRAAEARAVARLERAVTVRERRAAEVVVRRMRTRLAGAEA